MLAKVGRVIIIIIKVIEYRSILRRIALFYIILHNKLQNRSHFRATGVSLFQKGRKDCIGLLGALVIGVQVLIPHSSSKELKISKNVRCHF